MMRRGALFVATLILLGGMGQARAGSILDFNLDAVHPAGASISYAGGATPLVGTDLSVDSVVGKGTPLNALSILNLTGGRLDFQTGNLTGSDSGHWFFGPGGSISITTTAPIVAGASNTLLSGTFTSAEVDYSNDGIPGYKVVIAAFVNSVDDKLAAYYRIPPGLPWAGNLNFSFFAAGIPPGAFNSFSSDNLGSGDVITSAIPEPGSLLMGSIAVAGLALFRFHRRGA